MAMRRGLVAMMMLLSAVVDAYRRDEFKNFIEWYEQGVQAYLENNWYDCVTNLERALHEYRDYYNAVTGCRVQCGYEMMREKPFYDLDSENLQFFDSVIKRTLCLTKCSRRRLKIQYGQGFYMDKEYKHIFRSKKAYEYLQLCLYRQGDLEKAASAAYTVLMQRPDDKMMLDNMKYYLEVKNVDVSAIKDLEEQRFIKFYFAGLDAYNQQDWPAAIEAMEESLYNYILDENECRSFCEGEFSHGWLPDFYPAIANHFTNTLFCKQNCTEDMRRMRGEIHPDVLASHYEYLQFAYFKLGQVEKSCHALASFLLFHPNDKEMLYNMDFYRKQPGVREEFFTAREEAKTYHQRQSYERKLLNFIFEEFGMLAEEDKQRDEVMKAEWQAKENMSTFWQQSSSGRHRQRPTKNREKPVSTTDGVCRAKETIKRFFNDVLGLYRPQ